MAQVIKRFARTEVLQDAPGAYRVQSTNNICLHECTSPTEALDYAEWFDRHYFAMPKVLQPDPAPRVPMGPYWHPGDEA
jgi:hypothetical protein